MELIFRYKYTDLFQNIGKQHIFLFQNIGKIPEITFQNIGKKAAYPKTGMQPFV